MLSEEVIDKVVERLTNRIEITNEYVLKEIGKSIKEVGTITPSKRNQLIQTLKYGGDFDKIVKKIAKITDMNVYDIYKIFDEIAKNDYRFAKQFYDYKKKKYIPYELNEELQRQIRTLASMTAKEYLNLTNTKALGFGWVDDKTGEVTFKGLKKAYYDLLDEAVLSISEGKETFYDAMYRQLKKFGDSGLKVVYESGRAIRLDSAVRMCVKSGLTNMHMEMQKQIGEEFGSDGVEITVHNNPAPDHEEAQGKQFSNDEFKKLQETGTATTYDGIDIDMIRYHSFRPIGTMNCYHYTFAIVLGVNRPQYSNEALQKIRDKNNEGFELDGKHYTTYQGTQMQRQLESAIRTQKDNLALGKASGSQKLIDKSEAKLRQLNKKYNELNQASGLRPKLNRLKNVDYGVKPGQNRAVSGIDNTKASVLSTSMPNYKDYNNNVDEIENDFYSDFNKKYNDLSDDEKVAMQKYGTYHYKDMQRHLLGLELLNPEDHTINELDTYIKNLDNVLDNNILGKDVCLFRGDSAEYYKDFKIGDTIDFNLFASTSFKSQVASRFYVDEESSVLIKILAGKKTKGFYFGDFATKSGEQEFLLSRKTKFRYIGKEKTIEYYSQKEIEQIILEVIE